MKMKMKTLAISCAAVLSFSPVLAAGVTDADLDAALSACVGKDQWVERERLPGDHGPMGMPKRQFKKGWEHCSGLEQEKSRRERDAREADEKQNPDLKFSRDIAKGLGVTSK